MTVREAGSFRERVDGVGREDALRGCERLPDFSRLFPVTAEKVMRQYSGKGEKQSRELPPLRDVDNSMELAVPRVGRNGFSRSSLEQGAIPGVDELESGISGAPRVFLPRPLESGLNSPDAYHDAQYLRWAFAEYTDVNQRLQAELDHARNELAWLRKKVNLFPSFAANYLCVSMCHSA